MNHFLEPRKLKWISPSSTIIKKHSYYWKCWGGKEGTKRMTFYYIDNGNGDYNNVDKGYSGGMIVAVFVAIATMVWKWLQGWGHGRWMYRWWQWRLDSNASGLRSMDTEQIWANMTTEDMWDKFLESRKSGHDFMIQIFIYMHVGPVCLLWKL